MNAIGKEHDGCRPPNRNKEGGTRGREPFVGSSAGEGLDVPYPALQDYCIYAQQSCQAEAFNKELSGMFLNTLLCLMHIQRTAGLTQIPWMGNRLPMVSCIKRNAFALF